MGFFLTWWTCTTVEKAKSRTHPRKTLHGGSGQRSEPVATVNPRTARALRPPAPRRIRNRLPLHPNTRDGSRGRSPTPIVWAPATVRRNPGGNRWRGRPTTPAMPSCDGPWLTHRMPSGAHRRKGRCRYALGIPGARRRSVRSLAA